MLSLYNYMHGLPGRPAYLLLHATFGPFAPVEVMGNGDGRCQLPDVASWSRGYCVVQNVGSSGLFFQEAERVWLGLSVLSCMGFSIFTDSSRLKGFRN